jgi:tetratricopeptide (TPR) repeat protein
VGRFRGHGHAQVLPDLPSPKSAIEWVRKRPSRRKIVIWCTVAIVLLAGGAAVTPRFLRAVKGWQARRLAGQASVLITQQNWQEASKKLQSAFQLRNTEPEIWRVYARLLSRTGQGNLALEYWQKVGQSRPLSLEDHRDYAAGALSASELAIAAEHIAFLLSQPNGPSPQDLLLAAQLATVRGYNATARGFAERVLADSRANSRERLGANLVILSNSSPDTQSYQDAAQRLLDLARNEADPASPEALTVLGQRRSADRLTTGPNEPLAIPTSDVATNPMSLSEIADRLERNPNSRPFHRMLALELRARVEPGREDELVSKAVQSYRRGDDETLRALGAWLYTRHRFDSMLTVLPLERAVQRRELLLERIDALAALRRFTEVREILVAEYPVLEPAFQHMYLAAVEHDLGETAASSNEWSRAMQTAKSPRTLIGLADYAENRNELELADAAYARLIEMQPGLKSAYFSRLKLAQVAGQTAKAHDVASEIVRLWPEDDPTRMREVYLRVLLDQSPERAKAAEEYATPFVAKNPWDGVARSAVALARLRQGKSAAALTILTEFNSKVPSSAISRSVYAAALAANGWKDNARSVAKELTTARLLPEERAMIAPLLSNGDR